MNKRELLLALKNIPDDATILVAGDEEFNRLNELYAIEHSHIVVDDGGTLSTIDERDFEHYEDEQISDAYILWG